MGSIMSIMSKANLTMTKKFTWYMYNNRLATLVSKTYLSKYKDEPKRVQNYCLYKTKPRNHQQ